MRYRRAARIAGALLTPAVVIGAIAGQAGAATSGSEHHGALYVAPHAHAGAGDWSCQSAAYKTIRSAVKAAPAGGTVVVCPGTYHEQVAITKPLRLEGIKATIDESGVKPAFTVNVPHIGPLVIFAAVITTSSHVGISGFTVRNALGEGILAAGVNGTIHDISIRGNVVVNNDLGGGVPPKSSYFECAASGQVPGDCGEGVHFLSVAWSTISGNYVSGNSGGILLTDETGPTHGNVVSGNVVTRNQFDCGITVPGHNPMALNSKGALQPSVAGVYDNVIRSNVVTDNGLKGEGAGVLFATGAPGSASYDNLATGNYIAGNGLAGVTMHAHTLGKGQHEFLSGNDVVGNVIGRNNITGDPLDSPSPATGVHDTTGVLVFSAGTHVSLRIAHNHIFDNHFGIWLSKPVSASGLRSNSFSHVTIPVSSGH
ncbi:MAG TPA: right-handed parallel beta-helix repeat-containing protein [Streptosporangiaceae bacterium]